MPERFSETLLRAALIAFAVFGLSFSCLAQEGTAAKPLRVMLIPADGGAKGGKGTDFQPLFSAVTQASGLKFDIKVATSYSAVVDALCNRTADIAFFGAVAYLQARSRACAKLLAVAVEDGESSYYATVFVASDSKIKNLQDLKGKRVAFGDVNSASSFTFPIAMLLDAKIDPVKDLAAVKITGSHADSLKALTSGAVDAACASFATYQKGVKQGAVDKSTMRVLAKSVPIPNPPIAMNPALPADIQKKLKDAFGNLHNAPGMKPGMVPSLGWRKVDSYDVSFSEDAFGVAATKMAQVTEALKSDLVAKAGRS